MQMLLKYSWPGNVRELDHTIERGVLLSQSSKLRIEDLGLQAQKESPKGIEEMSLEEVESFLIKKALDRYNGNVSQAAKALGLSRSALYRRLQRYGL
jgi:transcriptional regulator of acetoin/glycerol metabolism